MVHGDRQSKKLYAWETGPVDDLAMVLLCGEPEFKVCVRSFYVYNQLTTPSLALCEHRVYRQKDQIPLVSQDGHCYQAAPVADQYVTVRANAHQAFVRNSSSLERVGDDGLG